MDVPAFIVADPIFWFTLIESIFTSQKIINVRDKINAILLALPNHLQLETKPFLSKLTATAEENSDEKKKIYEDLKRRIITITSIPEEQRLQELLHSAHIGTRTPSQFLNYLRNLQGDAGDRDNKFIRLIFLQNLPTDIRNILIAQQKENLDDMAATADLLWQKPNGAISCTFGNDPVPVVSQNSDITQQISEIKSSYRNEVRELELSLADLSKKMDDMRINFQQSINALRCEVIQLREQQSNRNPSAQLAVAAGKLPGENRGHPNFNSLCYFHEKFGNSAYRCVQPCNFNPNNQGN